MDRLRLPPFLETPISSKPQTTIINKLPIWEWLESHLQKWWWLGDDFRMPFLLGPTYHLGSLRTRNDHWLEWKSAERPSASATSATPKKKIRCLGKLLEFLLLLPHLLSQERLKTMTWDPKNLCVFGNSWQTGSKKIHQWGRRCKIVWIYGMLHPHRGIEALYPDPAHFEEKRSKKNDEITASLVHWVHSHLPQCWTYTFSEPIPIAIPIQAYVSRQRSCFCLCISSRSPVSKRVDRGDHSLTASLCLFKYDPLVNVYITMENNHF